LIYNKNGFGVHAEMLFDTETTLVEKTYHTPSYEKGYYNQ